MEREIVKIHHKAEESHASLKKRNVVQRSIVAVKVETNDKKQKSDGPPSDSWSWRKYGQKPIKGTPYPRGYYKCSTSKGCTAKKQVERSKTDSSMLIITYTSTHNHPGPDLPIPEENPKTPNQEEESKKEQQKTLEDEADLHYSQSPFHHSQDIITTNQEVINCTNEKLDLVPTVAFDENPPNSSHPDQTMNVAKCKADENDFFNELDELPFNFIFH